MCQAQGTKNFTCIHSLHPPQTLERETLIIPHVTDEAWAGNEKQLLAAGSWPGTHSWS